MFQHSLVILKIRDIIPYRSIAHRQVNVLSKNTGKDFKVKAQSC